MKHLSDAQLVGMIYLGAPPEQINGAVTVLLKRYSAKIKAMVRGNNGNDFDGDEVVNDTLLELVKNISEGRYVEEGRLDSYVMVMAKRIWLKKRDKDQVRKKYEADAIGKGFMGGQAKTFSEEDKVIREEETQNPFGIFSLLPPNYQQVLRLFMEKYSMEDIAEIMRLPSADAAKTQKNRAKNRFIELYNKFIKQSDRNHETPN
ncbi:MAG: RNA polymerase sigma factor [Runella sp.]